jgi:hypothetical protein
MSNYHSQAENAVSLEWNFGRCIESLASQEWDNEHNWLVARVKFDSMGSLNGVGPRAEYQSDDATEAWVLATGKVIEVC